MLEPECPIPSIFRSGATRRPSCQGTDFEIDYLDGHPEAVVSPKAAALLTTNPGGGVLRQTDALATVFVTQLFLQHATLTAIEKQPARTKPS